MENDEVEVKGNIGKANFVMKCKNCSRNISISFLKDSPKKIKLNDINGKGEEVFASFDCRSCEITFWEP